MRDRGVCSISDDFCGMLALLAFGGICGVCVGTAPKLSIIL